MEHLEEKREQRRFETGSEYRAQVNGSVEVSIKNISRGGICLLIPLALGKNDISTIELLCGGKSILSLSGYVVWSTFWGHSATNADISFYETGFKFMDLGSDVEEALDRFIKGLAKELS